MITITLATQKGGVSKTTTSEALILGLKRKGLKVLAIDLDSQGNLSNFLNPEATCDVFDFLDGKTDGRKCIQKDLIAGGPRLAYVPQYFENNPLTSLKDKLTKLKLDYDVCVIDTPPAISKVVFAALACSDYVIIPTEASKDSLDGVNQTLEAIEAVNNNTKSDTKLLGVVIVKYKERFTVHRQFKESLEKTKKFPVFKTTIRESQAINNAKTYNEDFFGKEYMHANAVQDYRDFVKEVMSKTKLKAK